MLFSSGTRSAVDTYVATGRQVLVVPEPGPLPDDPAIRSLQAQATGPLLPELDSVVQAYQRESERRVSTILLEERGILALTLLTLVVEALLVFRPMSRRIEHQTQRLEQASARHRAEAARHAFSPQLRDAVDLTDTEPDLVATVLQAVTTGGVPGTPELLLTPRRAEACCRSLARHAAAPSAPQTAAPHCDAAAPCPSPDSHGLGACAHLRRDAAAAGDEHVASVCVPVTFLGTGLGVLRTVTPAGETPDERARDALKTFASTAGTHVGTLRAFARSRPDAERDPMTGLLNRRGLQQAVNRLEAQRCPFVVVAIDLDHFKEVNDAGHDVGDGVLVETVRTMNSVLRPGDILARHGGEEFVVVVPLSGEGPPQEDGLAAGFAVAELIRVAVAAAHEGGNGPSCTASLGVVGPVASDLDDALRRADTALYRAKSLGRNRVEVAGELLVESPRDPSAVWT
jgi:diguanylate cyclase (GGDEF)-like protein